MEAEPNFAGALVLLQPPRDRALVPFAGERVVSYLARHLYLKMLESAVPVYSFLVGAAFFVRRFCYYLTTSCLCFVPNFGSRGFVCRDAKVGLPNGSGGCMFVCISWLVSEMRTSFLRSFFFLACCDGGSWPP